MSDRLKQSKFFNKAQDADITALSKPKITPKGSRIY